MPLPRELSEVQSATRDIVLEGVRKVAVGFVTKVNGQFVDVQLCTTNPLFDETKGTTFESPPILGNVPWCSTRGGGFIVWVPPLAGDSCLIIYTDISYDSWRQSDGKSQVNPGWCGRHTADSPFAIPMIAPDTRPITDAVPGTVVIGQDGGNGQIRISSTEIDLGFPATDAVALASRVMTELGKIKVALTTIVTTCPAGAGTGTATYLPAAVASTLVKCS